MSFRFEMEPIEDSKETLQHYSKAVVQRKQNQVMSCRDEPAEVRYISINVTGTSAEALMFTTAVDDLSRDLGTFPTAWLLSAN